MSTVRSMPLFDTHKAVKALSHAGFDDTQAEAVVEQINEAVNENVATKSDFERFVAKLDLERFATKEDLERFATKEDLMRFATKEDLKRFATKEDLLKLELRINEKFDKFSASLLRYALGLVGLAVALTKALDFVVG
ncbi:MAG: hypothetical protein OXG82_00485 [Gammaproteobacteria bacterium]|nr:hypothetical protein [Gammaproteobacteria bacterium]